MSIRHLQSPPVGLLSRTAEQSTILESLALNSYWFTLQVAATFSAAMPASAGEAAAAHRRRGGGHGSSSGGGGGGGSGCCRLAAALLLLLAAAVPQAHAQTTYAVTATGLTNGTTPDLMGLSLGHAYVDSNW